MTSASLTTLTPWPYRLAYAIPLLLVSVILTFAGAFLTLDRTRSFPPQSVSTGSPTRTVWRLEGGIGGLLFGWAFGVHLSTLLALIIINRTSTPALGSIIFLVVWSLSATSMTLLSGRLRYVALVVSSAIGGAAFAVVLAVTLHPSLLPRLILLAVFPAIFLIATIQPVPHIRRAALRTSAALAGAFGVILSCALLGGMSDWANVWERFWLPSNAAWGSGREKGMSAALCILAVVGACTDWLLHHKIGENPDQKWDEYLSNYAANLPSANDRAGNFQPLKSFWERIFKPDAPKPVVFPSDVDLKPTAGRSKARGFRARKSTGGARPMLKFSQIDEMSSDSESETDVKRPSLGEPNSSASLSGATLYSPHRKVKSPPLDDYSDGEDVSTAVASSPQTQPDGPNWKPAFLTRHLSESPSAKSGSQPDGASGTPQGAVPVTPSLIKALDRIAVAQNAAYGARPSSPSEPADDGNRWKTFWRDVDKTRGDS